MNKRNLLLSLLLICTTSFGPTATSAPAQAAATYPEAEHVGGDITAPQLLTAPPPKFSEDARKNKQSGAVIVKLIVDTSGMPTHVAIVRGVGYGLDEEAIEAVKRYRFTPAMRNGQPVAVRLNIQVQFNIVDRDAQPKALNDL